ncbi:hypothetical protein GH153_00315, partial [bacterium]|nr:hypothetical protein [bacterium]
MAFFNLFNSSSTLWGEILSFPSVKIEKDSVEIDGKSILGILTLAAVKGSQITLIVSGKDEATALKALVA